MSPDEAATILRAEVKALADASGRDVHDYQENVLACDPQLKGRMLSMSISLRMTATERQLAALRSGYLAQQEGRGWRIRDDNTPNEGGWGVLDDRRGFAIALKWSSALSASIVSSGPCLPASAGTPTTHS